MSIAQSPASPRRQALKAGGALGVLCGAAGARRGRLPIGAIDSIGRATPP